MRSRARSWPFSLFSALLAAPLTAQWQLVPTTLTPPARTGYQLLPFPSGELLLFGGDLTAGATEWLWDGIGWQPTTTPVPRRSDAAATEFAGGRLVVHGGTGVAGPLFDTWVFTPGTGWANVAAGPAPSAFALRSMAGEPGQERAVLIGSPAVGTFETWFFTLAGGWTQGPGFQALDARVVADPVRGEVVQFRRTATGVERCASSATSGKCWCRRRATSGSTTRRAIRRAVA
jgi:hypothetical protein